MDDTLISRQTLLAWQDNALSADFNHYLSSTKAKLCEFHGENNTLLQEIAPFEWIPPDFFEQDSSKRRAVLLIHGLLGTPGQLYDIGQAFLQQGYLVRSILLTGHGLIDAALDHVHWQDWAKLVNFACQALAKDVGKFVILGYSGGGALALQQALEPNNSISHLISIAPPLRIHSPVDFMIPWLAKWPSPWYFSSHHFINSFKYQTFSQYLANQGHQLAKATRDKLLKNPFDTASLFVFAQHDETIDSCFAKKLLLKKPNANLEICWYSRHEPNEANHRLCTQTFSKDIDPSISAGNEASLGVWQRSVQVVHDFAKPLKTTKLPVERRRVYWRTSYYPELNIQDYTHTSLCASPDNPLEGLSAYREACDIAIATKTPMPRLSFNPDFAYMTAAMTSFCEKET